MLTIIDHNSDVASKKAEVLIFAQFEELELVVPSVENDVCAAGRINPPCPLVKDTAYT